MNDELKIGRYYFLANGQCVVLDDFAMRPDGTELYMVTPYYEGECMTVSGDGGYHQEYTADYIHEGLPVLVDRLFKSAPTEKLCPTYKEKLGEIERLALAIGVLKLDEGGLLRNKTILLSDIKDYEKASTLALAAKNRVKEKLENLTELADEKRQSLSKLEDSIGRFNEEGEMVVINKKELQRLNMRDFKLTCLEGGGVDNWEWYEESLKDYCARYPKD